MPSVENVWDDNEDHDSMQVNQQKDKQGMTVTVNDVKCLQTSLANFDQASVSESSNGQGWGLPSHVAS